MLRVNSVNGRCAGHADRARSVSWVRGGRPASVISALDGHTSAQGTIARRQPGLGDDVRFMLPPGPPSGEHL